MFLYGDSGRPGCIGFYIQDIAAKLVPLQKKEVLIYGHMHGTAIRRPLLDLVRFNFLYIASITQNADPRSPRARPKVPVASNNSLLTERNLE